MSQCCMTGLLKAVWPLMDRLGSLPLGGSYSTTQPCTDITHAVQATGIFGVHNCPHFIDRRTDGTPSMADS